MFQQNCTTHCATKWHTNVVSLQYKVFTEVIVVNI